MDFRSAERTKMSIMPNRLYVYCTNANFRIFDLNLLPPITGRR